MRRNRLAVATSFLVSVALLGCGDDGSTVDLSEDLSGVWSFSDSLLNWPSFRSPSCTSGSGTLTISQVGTTLTGSLTDDTRCLVTDTTNLGDRAGSITLGAVVGGQVSFEVAFCEYQAATSGSPPTLMSGTEVCLLHLGGTDSVFYDGPWQATR